jgi:hypothetical protein
MAEARTLTLALALVTRVAGRRWFSALITGLLIFPPAAFSTGAVDPALVGKWQLQYVGQPLYWDIRADGTYELSGAGGAVVHTGSFHAAAGQWSLDSPIWGKDGGGYQLPNPNTFVATGRLGVGVWVRASSSPTAATGVGEIVMATQPDGARALPKDIPELMHAATRRARLWRADAIPVALEFKHLDVPNPAMRGPEVRVSFLSPSEGTGLFVTVSASGTRTFEFNQRVNWGTISLPPVFVDLPAAVRIARKHGMTGTANGASLRVWSPSGAPPVLAWMVGNKTVNGATGEIIDYDVTGYIASYNAQWERAARGLRMLMRGARGGSSSRNPTIGGDSAFPSSSSSSDAPYDDGSQARAEHERNAAESRAYWSGDPELYNRVKNGECTWSDSSKVGC